MRWKLQLCFESYLPLLLISHLEAANLTSLRIIRRGSARVRANGHSSYIVIVLKGVSNPLVLIVPLEVTASSPKCPVLHCFSCIEPTWRSPCCPPVHGGQRRARALMSRQRVCPFSLGAASPHDRSSSCSIYSIIPIWDQIPVICMLHSLGIGTRPPPSFRSPFSISPNEFKVQRAPTLVLTLVTSTLSKGNQLIPLPSSIQTTSAHSL
jgi:hypothetical protein